MDTNLFKIFSYLSLIEHSQIFYHKVQQRLFTKEYKEKKQKEQPENERFFLNNS
jgi:hypothetical protein